MFFLELSCFFHDPEDVGNLISGSSVFSKTSLNMWKFTVYVLLNLAWRILSITLLACEMSLYSQQKQDLELTVVRSWAPYCKIQV